MMLHLWCSLVFLSVISRATGDADLHAAEGHAKKFFAPNDDDVDALVHLEKLQEKAQFSDFSPRIFEDAVNEAIHNLTEQYDPIHIPFLPTINIKPEGINADVSLTVADINIDGLSSLEVMSLDILNGILPSKNPKIYARVKRLGLDANHYSSGGHVINVPFSGEGNLTIAFHRLNITIGFETQSSLKPCAVKGSSYVDFELGHMVVDFEGMDPGTDLGETINTVLGSFGPDIIDAIETQLMKDPLHTMIDEIFVDAVNNALSNNDIYPVDCSS